MGLKAGFMAAHGREFHTDGTMLDISPKVAGMETSISADAGPDIPIHEADTFDM